MSDDAERERETQLVTCQFHGFGSRFRQWPLPGRHVDRLPTMEIYCGQNLKQRWSGANTRRFSERLESAIDEFGGVVSGWIAKPWFMEWAKPGLITWTGGPGITVPEIQHLKIFDEMQSPRWFDRNLRSFEVPVMQKHQLVLKNSGGCPQQVHM